jgi:hypothetical protein
LKIVIGPYPTVFLQFAFLSLAVVAPVVVVGLLDILEMVVVAVK